MAVKISRANIDGTNIDGTNINGTNIDGTDIDGAKTIGTNIDGTKINGAKINGLLGRSLKHSFSVAIHRELGNPDYGLYELEPEQLDFLFRHNSIDILNVTIPYKKSVLAYCDQLSLEARATGSVNTIVSTGAGLVGLNTDVFGFAYMAKRAGISFQGKQVLIFGSGGASAAVKFLTEQALAKKVTVVSRSGEPDYQMLSDFANYEILVNTTPLGMYPETIGCTVVELEQFAHCEAVLDVVYNPLRTALIMQAEELGIIASGGLSMLVAQALPAEELFQSREIDDKEIDHILSQLYRDLENIVLIGMPGSGKTTIGRKLSELTGRELVDLDDKIVEVKGMSIPEIFSRYGEAEFRRIESEQAAAYGAMNGKIIVAGGGIVKDIGNYPALHQNGRLYHITRETSLLARTGRPLSLEADLEKLYEERLPLYTRFRDVVISNSSSPRQAAEDIWREFSENTCR